MSESTLPTPPATPQTRLAKLASFVLNPTTPVGHKVQGFVIGTVFFFSCKGGSIPQPVQNFINALLVNGIN